MIVRHTRAVLAGAGATSDTGHGNRRDECKSQ